MLPIVTHPNESLRERSTEVDRDFLLQPATQQLIRDMVTTMYEDDGIGLAAPQIGQNIRLIIIGKEAHPEKLKDFVLINPTWQKTSRRKTIDTEGCLSVPKVFGKVRRWKNILVQALDENGTKLEFEAKDFFARVIQHEVDHLDGILFIDKATGIYEVE